MIKLQVIGNLGKDAVVNNVNGKTVINFTVAHTERYKDAQGVQKDRTTWVDCAYWTDRTAVAPYLKKGTQVYVEGNPDVRTFATQDGRQGAALTLRISTVQLLGSKNTDNNGGGSAHYNAQQQQPSAVPVYSQPASSYSQPAQETHAATPATGELTEPLDDLPF
jgi:single-strand DNA-binding protein